MPGPVNYATNLAALSNRLATRRPARDLRGVALEAVRRMELGAVQAKRLGDGVDTTVRRQLSEDILPVKPERYLR